MSSLKQKFQLRGYAVVEALLSFDEMASIEEHLQTVPT